MSSSHRIGVAQGTALYVGAVLGGGVLALPALTAREAGPASLVAWALMVAFCIPIAGSFAVLGMRYPDGGGVATFAAKAFGPRTSAPVGWLFYFAVPVGTASAAIVGGSYVADALGGGYLMSLAVAAALLFAAYVSNWMGLRLSGGLQLLLVGMLAALMAVAIMVAAPDSRAENFTPFAPHGWMAVGHAATLLFFAFSGWEAVSHLGGEFSNPRRQLPIVTGLTIAVVAVLYLGVATTSMAVLGSDPERGSVPLTLLLERGIGDSARAVTAVAAALLTFATVNAYIAGGSRLGAALGRDGDLPRWLGKGNGAGEIPKPSLVVLASLTAVLLTSAAVLDIRLDPIMTAASACFVAVYVAGLSAAAKLLRGSPWGRLGAVVSLVAVLVVFLFFGWYLLLPVSLVIGAKIFQRVTAGRSGPAGTGQDTADSGAPAAEDSRTAEAPIVS
ncbi:amino acid permease [Streptomyces sp. S.PNR 29]|uniref:APC family permease n=1 Tax=Streptomyces sp. S.PNR 29 TaxID=2973805 RepID=UPI0025B07137|nr:amino acid permease [Streptomyces sp. S.PNR 29]MDN0200486.1 amino acid permease [Streptomyces sp. S.PNR 29]